MRRTASTRVAHLTALACVAILALPAAASAVGEAAGTLTRGPGNDGARGTELPREAVTLSLQIVPSSGTPPGA